MDFAPYAPAIIALAGTIVGAAASVGAQLYIAHAAKKAERQAVAHAIAAEIEAYIRLVDMRQVFERGEQIIRGLRAGQDLHLKGFGVAADEDLDGSFPIFRALLAKLGVLGALAGDVVSFYATASAVRATARAGERGAFDAMPIEDRAAFIHEELRDFRECVDRGVGLTVRLRRV